MPRTIPATLLPSVQASSKTMCYLLRIVPRKAEYPAYGVTTLDQDVVYDDGAGDLTYSASIGMVPSTLLYGSDLSVEEIEASSLLPEFDVPISEADIVAGVYDGAKAYVYLVNYMDLSQGHIELLRGTIGRVTITDKGLSIVQELRPLSQNLKQSVTEKWSLGCRATYGSQPGGPDRYPCNKDLTADWDSGAVAIVGVESNQSFTTSGLTPLYGGNPGKVLWTSGANTGRDNEVDQFDVAGGVITIGLTFPTDFPIQAGDTFDFRDDCPKTPAACKARSNWQNYRGEPNIPVADQGQMQIPGASAGVGTGAPVQAE